MCIRDRATSYLPKELLKLLYTALIRSHMEYCSSIFSSAAQMHLKKLDVIQRKAARIIYEVPRDAHADILLLFLKLDELGDRREAQCQAHQVISIRKMSPSYAFNDGSLLWQNLTSFPVQVNSRHSTTICLRCQYLQPALGFQL